MYVTDMPWLGTRSSRDFVVRMRVRACASTDGVPIFFFFEAGGGLDISFRAALCLADQSVRAAIVPTASIYVEVGGGEQLSVPLCVLSVRC